VLVQKLHVLAVLIDQIQPPTYRPNPTANLSPKRRKLTRFYTNIPLLFDIVLLVLEIHYFAEFIHKCGRIIVKRHKPGRRKHRSTQRNEKKAYLPIKTGPTIVDALQAQLAAHYAKAVANRASLGVGAPRVCPYHPQLRPDPSLSGGALMTCRDGFG
jgi:hypothetical protein